jgi:hypothetical protein
VFHRKKSLRVLSLLYITKSGPCQIKIIRKIDLNLAFILRDYMVLYPLIK